MKKTFNDNSDESEFSENTFPKKNNIKGNAFNEKCYEILKKVPRGKVVTYKQIANKLGTKAYRAVGRAMKDNPYAPKVSCHRVINSNGKLGGYSKGLKKKIQLLEKEGIEIINGKIDLKKYRWC